MKTLVLEVSTASASRFLFAILLSGLSLFGVDARIASALTVSSTDLWQGATVTTHSGVHSDSKINDMFGAVTAPSEPGNTVFKDGFPTATLHSVEWTVAAAVTLRSFVLFALHDGSPRDANYRGISSFKLFAYNDSTNSFESLFQYSPANPYKNSVAPLNGIVESNGYNLLALGVNLLPVTASKFRAEFVQFGLVDPSASGPRIIELDGFSTYLSQATVPSEVPLPAALPLFASGLGVMGLLAWRRRRKVQAAV